MEMTHAGYILFRAVSNTGTIVFPVGFLSSLSRGEVRNRILAFVEF
jgi:hypothetical protein